MSDIDLITPNKPSTVGDAGAVNAAEVRPVPRISIQAFCEQSSTMQSLQQCADDRRMSRTHMSVHSGGLAAAVEFYQNAPTPNVIVVEAGASISTLFDELEELSQVCDQETKVIIIGHTNDVELYRRLMRLGVAEYMVAPINHMEFVATIGEMYTSPEADPIGRVVAFIGAKGGVGSSTIAHNVAWSISSKYKSDTILADFDMAFGTVSLDFNQEPPQGIAEAVFAGQDLDDTLLERILGKCTETLSLLASPAAVDKASNLDGNSFDRAVEVCQGAAPNMVVDLPNTWNDYVASTLNIADEIVLVAAPDLANLRNSKNILDHLKGTRTSDNKPHLLINQLGRSKETEIKPGAFEDALEIEASVVLPYEPKLFGTAANNGQMIVEVDGKHAVVSEFDMLAARLTGRAEAQPQKAAFSIPFIEKLRPAKKRAG